MPALYENPFTDKPSFRHAIKQELANLHKEVDTLSVEDSEFYPAPALIYSLTDTPCLQDCLIRLSCLYQ